MYAAVNSFSAAVLLLLACVVCRGVHSNMLLVCVCKYCVQGVYILLRYISGLYIYVYYMLFICYCVQGDA